jgi:choline dehydrogenase-like flavoprotein
MATGTHYDVIIIGTGAGGGTLAHQLAPSGKRILLLERGPYLVRERDNWDSHTVFVQAKYRANETWLDAQGKPFHPGIQYYVGGNTKFYGAALFRLRPQDFGEIHHYGGLSPAWPLSYDDFEPYYTKAEYLYHVHGEHGLDPSEGPASAPYRYPAVRHEPRIQELADNIARLGLHPSYIPLGILLDQDEHGMPTRTSTCIRCDRFDGFPCPVRGKADAEVLCVEPALQHSNLTLLTEALVTRLETDPSGRVVSKVHVERAGEKEEYSADVVVSSCGAINSALLLLRSANDKHPNGLGNSSDVVGRHYMRHNNEALMAISKSPNDTRFQKTLAVGDYYFRDKDWDYPLGMIQMLGKTDGTIIRGEAPRWATLMPGMGFDEMARHSVDFWLSSEDLPEPDNRVTINSSGQVVLTLHETNMEGLKRLKGKIADLLEPAGMHPHHLLPHSLQLSQLVGIGGTAHQAGTVRFGTDPRASALDVNCKMHDLDNLYVVDGGFMPSIGAVNPALTIMANALRVSDHLLERLGA